MKPTTTRWFGWFLLIFPLHMMEQLALGLDALARLKRPIGAYYAHFAGPDRATMVLATMVGTLVYVCVLGALVGGRARLAVLGFFGVIGLSETHHVIETLFAGHYTPGTVTAIPYVAVGAAVCRAVLREWRAGKAPRSVAR